MGYSTKGNAKRMLTNNFESGVDFHLIISDKCLPTGGSTAVDQISLTVDCALHMAMMSQTKKGRTVRQMFIDAKKRYEQLKGAIAKQTALIPWEQTATERALEIAEAITKIDRSLGATQPEAARSLIDYALSDITTTHPVLPMGTELLTLVEIAQRMGYDANPFNWGQLGKYVKVEWGHIAIQQKRKINGKDRDACCYPEDHDG